MLNSLDLELFKILDSEVNTCIYFDIVQEPYLYRLDITKEIKDYTDEQKQELINFLKTL